MRSLSQFIHLVQFLLFSIGTLLIIPWWIINLIIFVANPFSFTYIFTFVTNIIHFLLIHYNCSKKDEISYKRFFCTLVTLIAGYVGIGYLLYPIYYLDTTNYFHAYRIGEELCMNSTCFIKAADNNIYTYMSEGWMILALIYILSTLMTLWSLSPRDKVKNDLMRTIKFN